MRGLVQEGRNPAALISGGCPTAAWCGRAALQASRHVPVPRPVPVNASDACRTCQAPSSAAARMRGSMEVSTSETANAGPPRTTSSGNSCNSRERKENVGNLIKGTVSESGYTAHHLLGEQLHRGRRGKGGMHRFIAQAGAGRQAPVPWPAEAGVESSVASGTEPKAGTSPTPPPPTPPHPTNPIPQATPCPSPTHLDRPVLAAKGVAKLGGHGLHGVGVEVGHSGQGAADALNHSNGLSGGGRGGEGQGEWGRGGRGEEMLLRVRVAGKRVQRWTSGCSSRRTLE